MVLLTDLTSRLGLDQAEQRQIVGEVSWEGYEALLSELGDSLQYRVTYLDGNLELVSPSRRHERNKRAIGSLIELYCQEKRIRYFPLGSTTFRKEAQRGGTEPDESYCIETDKPFPDLAIEVVVTSGGLNKLEVYRRLEVREVWFFNAQQQFEVYILQGESYEKRPRSEILPGLDLAALAIAAIAPDPLEAAIAFREQVRGMQ
jgi:Uma2 family endonuclease